MKIDRLFKDGVLIYCNVSFWPGQYKVSDILKEYPFVQTKVSLLPKEILAKLLSIKRYAQKILHDYSFPFDIPYFRYVPNNILPELTEKLSHPIKKFHLLIDDISKNYPLYKLMARKIIIQKTPYILDRIKKIYNIEKEKEQFINEFIDIIDKTYPPVETLLSNTKFLFYVLKLTEYDIPKNIGDISVYQYDINSFLKKAIIQNRETLLKHINRAIKFLKIAIKKCQDNKKNSPPVVLNIALKPSSKTLEILKKVNFINDTYLSNAINHIINIRDSISHLTNFDDIIITSTKAINTLQELSKTLSNTENINKIAFNYEKNLLIQNL